MASVSGDDALVDFHAGVASNAAWLKQVLNELKFLDKSRGGANKSYPREHAWDVFIRDLLANAVRRAEYGEKYDDAVARMYCAVEKIAKIRLLVHHGLDNSRLEPQELSEAIRPDYAPLADPGAQAIKLPLRKSYELLARLRDEVGLRYETSAAELHNLLEVRNSSLLAHGFKYVRRETNERLLTMALDFIGASHDSLPQFPSIRMAYLYCAIGRNFHGTYPHLHSFVNKHHPILQYTSTD